MEAIEWSNWKGKKVLKWKKYNYKKPRIVWLCFHFPAVLWEIILYFLDINMFIIVYILKLVSKKKINKKI